MAEEEAQPEEEKKVAKAPDAEASLEENAAPSSKKETLKETAEVSEEGEVAPKEEEELAPGGVKKQPTAQDLLKEEIGELKIRKAKGSKNVTTGIAKVSATFNNTIVTITDTKVIRFHGRVRVR
jgi:small subunit ribosomal protein S11